jgi:phosphoribosylformylglycinamidine synthase
VRVEVTVIRRPDIADPQGTTIARALHQLGFDEVSSVRVDKVITLDVDADDPESLNARVDDMCRRLLANPVLEDFTVEVLP